MDIIEKLDGKLTYDNLVLTLGNFDGIHSGHRQLIATTVQLAQKIKGTPAAFTFDPHPLTVLKPDLHMVMLLTKEQKIAFFKKLGIQVLIIVPFSIEFACMSPEDFVQKVLLEKLAAKKVVVGYNFSFGYKGSGNPAILSSLGEKRGIETTILPQVTVNGQDVSSTIIRNLLLEGKVATASRLLGYRPFVQGEVVYGQQLGRTIGFPTANIALSPKTVSPANGVYAVEVCLLDGTKHKGIANIGVKPTVSDKQTKNLEVHIFDFVQSIYGQVIKVEFIEQIRPEKKFASLEKLATQIADDVSKVRDILK